MNIDSVNIDKNYYSKQTDAQYRKSESTENNIQAQQTRTRGDSLEISMAALNLANLRNRVKSGHYDNPDIIRETAERIYKTITQKTQPTEKQ